MARAFEMWRFLSTVAFTTHIAPTVVCGEIS
uniref:Uncharacterized protein n=1 Tax=Heterorhabditis bacteriophora TaxID=37862 RepID=A0A1I7XNS7_HETBA